MFARSPDPDHEDCLLKQYQAPITAALTPVFLSDYTPKILSLPVQLCAVFVGSSIVKDVWQMGRILRALIFVLEQSEGVLSSISSSVLICSTLCFVEESGMLALGNAGELSPNVSVMLCIFILATWAMLEVSSTM